MDLLPLFFIGIIIILAPLAYGAYLAAPWLPTHQTDVVRALDILNLSPGSTVIDIGCGDGRFLIEAAKRGHSGVGYEIAWGPALIGRIRARRAGVQKHVKIHIKNFFKTSLPQADAIVFFLMDGKRGKRIANYLESQIKPGAQVVAMVWPVVQWEERLVKRNKTEGAVSLYLYQF